MDVYFWLLFGMNTIHALYMLKQHQKVTFDKELIKRQNREFYIWLGYCILWSAQLGIETA